MFNEKNFRRLCNQMQYFQKFNARYPDVASCTITYIRSADGADKNYSDPHPHVLSVDITGTALVYIECINSTCTEGYLYLYPIIDSMVSNKEEYRKGELLCEKGWQDEERKGVHRCLSKLEYEIKIEYRNK